MNFYKNLSTVGNSFTFTEFFVVGIRIEIQMELTQLTFGLFILQTAWNT